MPTVDEIAVLEMKELQEWFDKRIIEFEKRLRYLENEVEELKKTVEEKRKMAGTRAICTKCKIEMNCARNDVAVWHPIEGKYAHEMMKDAIEGEQIDFVIIGDRYECPKCHASIVTGFGDMQISDYRTQEWLRQFRDEMEEKIRILRGGKK